jgi:hypothetical protein
VACRSGIIVVVVVVVVMLLAVRNSVANIT